MLAFSLSVHTDGNRLSYNKKLYGAINGVVIGFLWYRSNKILFEKLDIEKKVKTDDLTGLYNRRGFFTLASHQIELANRNKKEILLIYIDIDRLKKINDTIGHQKGDQALIEVSNILKDTFRKSDIIARMGGDEFVVFPINTAEESYEILIEHLSSNLESYNKNKNNKFKLSLSFGKASYNYCHPVAIDKLLSIADTDMYNKKRNKYKN